MCVSLIKKNELLANIGKTLNFSVLLKLEIILSCAACAACLAEPYFFPPTLSPKRRDFRKKKCTERKICVLTFSRNLV